MRLQHLTSAPLASYGRVLRGLSRFMPGSASAGTFAGTRLRKNPKPHSTNCLALEARVGIEPTNEAFAEPCLTTWLPRLRGKIRVIFFSSRSKLKFYWNWSVLKIMCPFGARPPPFLFPEWLQYFLNRSKCPNPRNPVPAGVSKALWACKSLPA